MTGFVWIENPPLDKALTNYFLIFIVSKKLSSEEGLLKCVIFGQISF